VAGEWLNGGNQAVPKMSLDPAKREHGDEPIIVSYLTIKGMFFRS